MKTAPKVLLATPGGWHLGNTAKAFRTRAALAGLWISGKNSTGITPELYRRLGEAAHRKGAIRNSWQDYGDRLLSEYDRRLNR